MRTQREKWKNVEEEQENPSNRSACQLSESNTPERRKNPIELSPFYVPSLRCDFCVILMYTDTVGDQIVPSSNFWVMQVMKRTENNNINNNYMNNLFI